MYIEIIDSVNTITPYSTADINALLAHEPIELNYGSAFMGRPSTQIYSDNQHIVKLRSELQLNGKRIREWVNHTLQQEKLLSIHHPQKTWFIVEQSEDNYTVGNICPRLTPLHIALTNDTLYTNTQKLEYLHRVYHAYFKIASQQQKRLDEGLSNFAIDSNNQIYYLDDDIYAWDDFLSFAHTLGVLIRSAHWLNEADATQLGQSLRQSVDNFFQDKHIYNQITRHLHDIYMPDPYKEQLFNNIIEQFQENKIVHQRKPFTERYWAIFADVHANLPALEVVLNFLRSENIHQGLVLGDIVGYGPHPTACIERLENSGFNIIKGNHDYAAISGDIRRGMSSTAHWAINWTIPQLNPAHKQWLDGLPLELSGVIASERTWLAVHGSPMDAQYFYGYVYTMTYQDNLNILAQRKIDICFHGHSHVQGIYARKKNQSDQFYNHLQQTLQDYQQCLICPGSVGQPRNGQLGAQFAIFDQQEQRISFHNLPYDMDLTLNAMTALNFPASLISRLRTGY